jgi:hypothetical protein
MDSAKANWEFFLKFLFNAFPHLSADMSIQLKQLLEDSKYNQVLNLNHLQTEPPIIEDSAEYTSFHNFKTDGSKLYIS